MLTRIQKEILTFLQKDLPLNSTPYRHVAEKLRLSEHKIVAEIKKLKASGYIRRVGAILNHNKIGLRKNCMCVWDVPVERIRKIAALALKQKEVSHCYLRKTAENWPYNFYTMIHAGTKAQCRNIVKNIAGQAKISNYEMLFTIKEFKKTSPTYKL